MHIFCCCFIVHVARGRKKSFQEEINSWRWNFLFSACVLNERNIRNELELLLSRRQRTYPFLLRREEMLSMNVKYWLRSSSFSFSASTSVNFKIPAKEKFISDPIICHYYCFLSWKLDCYWIQNWQNGEKSAIEPSVRSFFERESGRGCWRTSVERLKAELAVFFFKYLLLNTKISNSVKSFSRVKNKYVLEAFCERSSVELRAVRWAVKTHVGCLIDAKCSWKAMALTRTC